MNRNRYRLKFNDLVGCWVPVAEHMRARGNRGRCATLRVLVGAVSAAFSLGALANGPLPVAAGTFIAPSSPGMAAAPVVNGSTMTITQTTAAPVVMQWNSFSVDQGHTVRFVQPDVTSRAINVVLPGGPRSDIYGNIQANGQVFLFNQAGVLFGPNAVVDVGGLVASSLKLNDELINRSLSALGVTGAALSGDASAGDVMVQAGARIIAADNGRIVLAAPRVSNAGTLQANQGQVLLAAGEKVYLADSLDSRLRGLLIEVDNGGTVSNDVAGKLVAERGNITLAGLNVNQLGTARTTTSVTLNGSIYLNARDTMVARTVSTATGDVQLPGFSRTGDVRLGSASTTSVMPEETYDANGNVLTLRDDVAFNPSEVRVTGHRVSLDGKDSGGSGARILAPAANVAVTALARDGEAGRLVLGDGVSIDVSGVEGVAVDAGRNIVQVELRSNELKDSPLQRDPEYGRLVDGKAVGMLSGKKIWVDVMTGIDPATGAPLADVSGYRAGISRSVSELSTVGGSIALQAEGDVLVSGGATLDLSGGSVVYQAGSINESRLEMVGGTSVKANVASADARYTGNILDSTRQVAARTVGSDAGTLTVSGARVALDGRVNATTVNGQHQRDSAAARAALHELTLASSAGSAIVDRYNALLTERERQQFQAENRRFFEQKGRLNVDESTRAQGGTLRITGDMTGTTLLAPVGDVRFVTTTPARSFDMTSSAPGELLLSAGLFSGGIDHLALTSGGHVVLPEDVRISAAAGSSITLAAREIDLLGDVRLPGGAFVARTVDVNGASGNAATRDIVVGSGAAIDVSGAWTNDRISRPGVNNPPVVREDGGRIELVSTSDLQVSGALDVSAGGWIDGAGKFHPGDAGEISLASGNFGASTGTPPQSRLVIDGRLSGYAITDGRVAGQGGTLNLTASTIEVVDGADTNSSAGGVLTLGDDWVGAGGFEKISLGARGALNVRSGAHLQPQPVARLIDQATRAARSGSQLAGTGTLTPLDLWFRSPTSIELSSALRPNGGVTVEQGASIAVDAGGHIALRSNGNVTLGGTLTARGGSVVLTTQVAGSDETTLVTSDQIYLADTALIDVSGVVVYNPLQRAAGRYVGTLLGGGDVDIDAGRGFVVARAGAKVRADGAVAPLDLVLRSGTAAVRTDVASTGGDISISAREGVMWDAGLSARGGDASVAGGALVLALTKPVGDDWLGTDDPLYVGQTTLGNPALSEVINAAPRIVVSDDDAAGSASITAGGRVPVTGNVGVARIATDLISAGGFSDLTLRSNRLVEFSESVDLKLPGQLQIDAFNVRGLSDANVNLTAAHVLLGPQAASNRPLPPTATGSGKLSVQAEQIMLRGRSFIDGFDQVLLSAAGDIQATGALERVSNQLDAPVELRGGLATNADLTLRAAQIYPTSGSAFDIELRNRPDGVLRIESSGRTPGVALSAYGDLELVAPHIEQAGYLRAPMGSLSLVAARIGDTTGVNDSSALRQAFSGSSVTLLSGSVTSVAGDDVVVPFGTTTTSGREWVFSPGVVKNIESAPDKRVRLEADNVVTAAGSLVDLSGKGDVSAAEWVPGPGGSTDVLAPADGLQRYAVVPMVNAGSVPYDPTLWAESGLEPGATIELLTAAGGLPAGRYVLLPARYGLMEGAYVLTVRSAAGEFDVAASRQQVDGTQLVAARIGRTLSGATFAAAAPALAVEVWNGAQTRLRSEYIETKGSEFFDADGGARFADAGRLQLLAQSSLTLAGSLGTAAGTDSLGRRGAGAQIDVSGTKLAVIGSGASSDDSELAVDVATLNALGADSVLLGGTRARAADGGWVLADLSDQVRVATGDGEVLRAPELLFAATDRIEVAAGSRVEAEQQSGRSDAVYRVEGSGASADGAFVRVASAGQATLLRTTPVGARGDVIVGDGAVLAGRHLTLDATRSVLLPDNDVRSLNPAAGGSLTLSAGQLVLGDPAGTAAGLVLRQDTLDALAALSVLNLRSYGELTLVDSVRIGSAAMNNLSLDAASITGRDGAAAGSAAAVARVEAKNIVLTNSSAAASDVSGVAGRGAQLDIVASGDIELGSTASGEHDAGLAYAGFDQVNLSAGDEVVGSAQGTHRVSGALDVSAARVTTTTAANTTVRADGLLSVRGGDGAARAPSGLAGALSLQGAEVSISGRVDMNGGDVEVRALSGDVTVAEAARLSADGFSTKLGSQTVGVGAGAITLRSDSGDINLASGAKVSVAGKDGADAGLLKLSAIEGTVNFGATLDGAAENGGAGGALSLDVDTLGGNGSLSPLAGATGSFTQSRAVRVRSGDIRLDDGQTIRAERIALAADDGAITLAGTLDASGREGGDVRVFAQAGERDGSGRLTLTDTARILARGSVGDGGHVELGVSAADTSAQSPMLSLTAGSRIDVGSSAAGAAGGEVVLRAPRSDDGLDLALRADGTQIDGARKVWVESVKVYDGNEITAVGGDGKVSFVVPAVGARTPSSGMIGALTGTSVIYVDATVLSNLSQRNSVNANARTTAEEAARVIFGLHLSGAADGDDFAALTRLDAASYLAGTLAYQATQVTSDDSQDAEIRIAAQEAIAQAVLNGEGAAGVVAAALSAFNTDPDNPMVSAAQIAAAREAVIMGIGANPTDVARNTGATATQILGSVRAATGLAADHPAFLMLADSRVNDLITIPTAVELAAGAAAGAGSADAARDAAFAAYAYNRFQMPTTVAAGSRESVYQTVGASVSAKVDAIWAGSAVLTDTRTVIQHGGRILDTVGLGNVAGAGVRAAAEIRANGDLVVSQELNFGEHAIRGGTAGNAQVYVPYWRDGEHAGSLTLAATGDVRINATISDGVDRFNNTRTRVAADNSSWSMRVVAGADAMAADPMATTGDAGSVIVGAGRQLRTGEGRLEVSAAADVILGSATSAIYSIGSQDSELGVRYGQSGGDVIVTAGGDLRTADNVTAPPADVTNWLRRQAVLAADGSILQGQAPGWWAEYGQFGQGVATLGGGDLRVQTGGDVRNVVLAAAGGAQLSGEAGTQAAESSLSVSDAGNVSIRSAGDVLDVTLMSSAGKIDVDAGGRVGAADSSTSGVRVSMMDSLVRITAKGDAAVAAVSNPTLEGSGTQAYFSSYSAQSSLGLTSLGGDVFLGGGGKLPASLSLVSVSGGAGIAGGVMHPSAQGALDVLALNDVNFTATLVMSDVAPSALPSIRKPVTTTADRDALYQIGEFSGAGRHDPDLLAARGDRRVHVLSATGDVNGPDSSSPSGVFNALVSPIPVMISAARDIRDFGLRVDHPAADSSSLISAGRDVIFSTTTSSPGGPLIDNEGEGIVIGGGGELLIAAGRDVVLANSYGIVSRGNYDNPYLPASASAIQVLAGTSVIDYEALLAYARPGTAIGDDSFDRSLQALLAAQGTSLDAVLADEQNAGLVSARERGRADLAKWFAAWDEALLGAMRSRSNDPSLSMEGAHAAFATMSQDERTSFMSSQRVALNEILFASLRYVGRAGGALGLGPSGYAAGFQLMEKVFPYEALTVDGKVVQTEVNGIHYPQSAGGGGNIDLFRSQIKTEQDVQNVWSIRELADPSIPVSAKQYASAIALFAPFGSVNIGLPSGSGGDASRSGVVVVGKGNIDVIARDDIQVGVSRVFTLDGGSIQQWSSFGDQDAGRGSKTAAATPPPQLRAVGDGFVLDVSGSVSGSGIGTLKTRPDTREGDVRLYAPNGQIDAGDAGIRVSGNFEVGAQRVIGADNISVGGASSGTAVSAPAAAPVSGVSSNNNESQRAAAEPAATASGGQEQRDRNSILTVELVGLGDVATGSGCREDEKDCGEPARSN